MYQQSQGSMRRGSVKNVHRINWHNNLTARQVSATAQHYTGDPDAEAALRFQDRDRYFEVRTGSVLSDVEQVELNELCQLQAKWFDEKTPSPIQPLELDDRTDTDSHNEPQDLEVSGYLPFKSATDERIPKWVSGLPKLRELPFLRNKPKAQTWNDKPRSPTRFSGNSSRDSGVALDRRGEHPTEEEEPYHRAGAMAYNSAQTPSEAPIGSNDDYKNNRRRPSNDDTASLDIRNHFGYPHSTPTVRGHPLTAPP